MLYEHYGYEFYVGLLSLSYLVVYTQNYNQHYKVSTFLLHENFVIMLNLHLIYVLNLNVVLQFNSSLYCERLKFTKKSFTK